MDKAGTVIVLEEKANGIKVVLVVDFTGKTISLVHVMDGNIQIVDTKHYAQGV